MQDRINIGHVVFITDKVFSRIAKLAFGLRNKKYKVDLLYTGECFLHDLHESFDNVYCCSDKTEVVEISRTLAADVYHIFASWKFDIASHVLKYLKGKIVFDNYDYFSGMIRPSLLESTFQEQAELEKYCCDKADGLCNRSLEFQFMKRQHSLKKKIIFFPDYCWGKPLCKQELSNCTQEETHIVYCGNLNFKKKTTRENISLSHYDTAKTFEKMGIHFHIFPAVEYAKVFDTRLHEYIELDNTSSFFHLHKPIFADQLIHVMAAFDFGFHSDYRLFCEQGNDVYTAQKRHSSISNKIFDYIDAELPVIIGRQLFQRWFLARAGVALCIDKDDLCEYENKNILTTHFAKKIKKTVMEFKDLMAVSHNVHRLIKFYSIL